MKIPFPTTLGQLAKRRPTTATPLIPHLSSLTTGEESADQTAPDPQDPLALIDAITGVDRRTAKPVPVAPPVLETPHKPAVPAATPPPARRPTRLDPFADARAYLKSVDAGAAPTTKDINLKADQHSEPVFQTWYADQAAQHNLNPDPDAKDQHYDYRAAFRAGAQPDASGHWPSQFKKDDHPNLVVGGFNTKTGQRAPGTPRASERELVRLGWSPDDAKRLTQQQDAQEGLMPPTPDLEQGRKGRAIQDRVIGEAAKHEAAVGALDQQIRPLTAQIATLQDDLRARSAQFAPERQAFQQASDALTAQTKAWEAAGRPAAGIPALEQAQRAFNARVDALNQKQAALENLTTAHNGKLAQLNALHAQRNGIVGQARAAVDQANRDVAALTPASLDDVGPAATMTRNGLARPVSTLLPSRGPVARVPGITAPEPSRLALPDMKTLPSINGVVTAALRGEQLPVADLSHVQPPTMTQSFVMGMANGLQTAIKLNPFIQGLGLVAGGASAATGLVRDVPTAVGEQVAGQSLPGHEHEQPTLVSRLASHAEMILSGRGGEVAPLNIPGAMINPPDTVAHQSDAQRAYRAQIGMGPADTGETRTRGRVEMGALEVARRGLDIVAQLLTDPVAVATMRMHTLGEAPAAAEAAASNLIAGTVVPGAPAAFTPQQLNTIGQVSGSILGAAFTVDALKGAAAVAQNPNATPEDVAVSVLNAAVMTVPSAVHFLGAGLKVANARLIRAAALARDEAARAQTITPDPSDIVVQPTRVGPPGRDEPTPEPSPSSTPSGTPPAPPPGPPGAPPETPQAPTSRPAAPYQRSSLPTAMQAELRSRGYTDEHLAGMTPEQAAQIIDSGARHAPAPTVPPELGPDATTPQTYTGPDRRGPRRVTSAEEDARYAASRAEREQMANGFQQTSPAAQENRRLEQQRALGPAPTGDTRDQTKYKPAEMQGLYADARVLHPATGHTGTVVEWFEGPAQSGKSAFRVQWDNGDQTVVSSFGLKITQPERPAAPASKPATSHPVPPAPEHGKGAPTQQISAPAPQKPWAEMSDEEQAAALMAELDAEAGGISQGRDTAAKPHQENADSNLTPPTLRAAATFTTPGTRKTWSTGREWADHAEALRGGRISSKVHRDRKAHLDELARHPDFIAAQPKDDLDAIKTIVDAWYKPPRGQRGGTSYEVVINEVNNALQRLAKDETPAAPQSRPATSQPATLQDTAGIDAIIRGLDQQRAALSNRYGDLTPTERERLGKILAALRDAKREKVGKPPLAERTKDEAIRDNVESALGNLRVDGVDTGLSNKDLEAEIRKFLQTHLGVHGDEVAWSARGGAIEIGPQPGHPGKTTLKGAQLRDLARDIFGIPQGIEPKAPTVEGAKDLKARAIAAMEQAVEYRESPRKGAVQRLGDDARKRVIDALQKGTHDVIDVTEPSPGIVTITYHPHGDNHKTITNAVRLPHGKWPDGVVLPDRPTRDTSQDVYGDRDLPPLPEGQVFDAKGYAARYFSTAEDEDAIEDLKATANVKALNKKDQQRLDSLKERVQERKAEAKVYYRLDTLLTSPETGWLKGEDDLTALSDRDLQRLQEAAESRARLEGKAPALKAYDDPRIEAIREEHDRRYRAEPKPTLDLTKTEPARKPFDQRKDKRLYEHEGRFYTAFRSNGSRDGSGFTIIDGHRVVPRAEYTGWIPIRTYDEYYATLQHYLPWEFGHHGKWKELLALTDAEILELADSGVTRDISRGRETGVVETFGGHEYVYTGETAKLKFATQEPEYQYINGVKTKNPRYKATSEPPASKPATSRPALPANANRLPQLLEGMGRERLETLLGHNDWALNADGTKIVEEGVSDNSRSTGAPGPTTVIPFARFANWLRNEAGFASDDDDYQELVDAALDILAPPSADAPPASKPATSQPVTPEPKPFIHVPRAQEIAAFLTNGGTFTYTDYAGKVHPTVHLESPEPTPNGSHILVWGDKPGEVHTGTLDELAKGIRAQIKAGRTTFNHMGKAESQPPAKSSAQYDAATETTPYSANAMKAAFTLTDAQADAVDALVDAMGLDTTLIRVTKGGTPSDGALTQEFPSHEELIALRDRIVATPEHRVTTEPWMSASAGDVRAEAMRRFAPAAPVVIANHDTKDDIVLSRQGIKNALIHGIKPQKVAVLAALRELLRDATFVVRDAEAMPDGITAIETYAGRVTIDDQLFVARIVVREVQDGRRFYDHELSSLDPVGKRGAPVPLRTDPAPLPDRRSLSRPLTRLGQRVLDAALAVKDDPDTLYQEANDPLYQGPKGAVEFAQDGKALVRALEGADVSTAVHEIAHVARRQLLNRSVPSEQRQGITDDDIDAAEAWAGAEDGWTRDAEEKFARGFERYLHDGTSPSVLLNKLFKKLAEWLKSIYQKLKGSDVDLDISPAMREVFDKLVTRAERNEGRGVDHIWDESEPVAAYEHLVKDEASPVNQLEGLVEAAAHYPSYLRDGIATAQLQQHASDIEAARQQIADARTTADHEQVEEDLGNLDDSLPILDKAEGLVRRELQRRDGQGDLFQKPRTAPAPASKPAVSQPVKANAPIVFRSGNQKAPADLDGYIKAGQPVGITHDAAYQVRARAAQYAQRGGQIFIDSGAFGVADPDFDQVFKNYDAFLQHAGQAHAGNLYFVAPDKVGDPDRTSELQSQYGDQIDALITKGANVIVPIQVGVNLASDAILAAERFPKALIGLPGNKAAITTEQLGSLLDEMIGDTVTPRGFHFLGVGEKNHRWDELVATVRQRFPLAVITADSNRTRALMAEGRPAHIATQQRTLEFVSQINEASDEQALKMIRGAWENPEFHDAVFTPNDLGDLQGARDEATRTAILRAIAERYLGKHVRPGIRTNVIAEHDQKPQAAPAPATADPKAPVVTKNAARSSVEVKFPEKPSRAVLDRLKAAGFRWAKTSGHWYKKERPGAMDALHAAAQKMVGVSEPAAAPPASKPAAATEFTAADASRLRRQLQTAQWALVGEKQRWEKAMRDGMAESHTRRILDTVKAYEKDIADLTATLTAHDAMPEQELGGYKVGDHVIQLHPRDPNDRTVYVVKALVPDENALRLEAADGSGRGAPAAPMNVRHATPDEWQRGSVRTTSLDAPARGAAKNYEVGDVVHIAGEPFAEVTITRIMGEDVEVKRPNGYVVTHHASRITNRVALTETKAMERLKAIHAEYGIVSSSGDERRVRDANNADQREAVLAKIVADHKADKEKSDAAAAKRAKELAAKIAEMQAEDQQLFERLKGSDKLAWRTVKVGKTTYWRPVSGKPVEVPGALPGLTFHVHRAGEGGKGWVITEDSTGLKAGGGATQIAATQAAANAFVAAGVADAAKLRAAIDKARAETPPNPYLTDTPGAIGAASPAGKKASAAEQAQALWDTFDANERHGVNLGLFPAAKMPANVPHAVTVALMQIAAKAKPAAPASKPAAPVRKPSKAPKALAAGTTVLVPKDNAPVPSSWKRHATDPERDVIFQPGNIVPSYSGEDTVLDYTPSSQETGGWKVKVHDTTETNAPIRVHYTQPYVVKDEYRSRVKPEWVYSYTAPAAAAAAAPASRPATKLRVIPIPAGWTAVVGLTRGKEGEFAEAEVDWQGKRLVFKNAANLANVEMRNHEIAHVVVETLMPDAQREALFTAYIDAKKDTPAWKRDGADWIVKNKFHREEIAMDLGTYFTTPDKIDPTLRAVFSAHVEPYVPGAPAAAAPASRPATSQPAAKAPSNVASFDKAADKRAHDALMDSMGTLTDDDIRKLDAVDDFGVPLSRADRGLEEDGESAAAPASRPATSQPAAPATVPAPTGSWKAEMKADGGWSSNALRFATKKEAEDSGHELMSRWFGASDTRAVESPDPVTHRFDVETYKNVAIEKPASDGTTTFKAGGVEFESKPLITKQDAAADNEKAKAQEERAKLIAEMKARRAKKDPDILYQDPPQSPAFKAWFGDSMAVDGEGRPLRAFHGTTADFTAFDTNRPSRKNADEHWAGDFGAWFTAPSLYAGNYDEEGAEFMASDFAGGDYRRGANVMPVYLSIQHPREFEDYNDFDGERGMMTGTEFREALQADGYDGAVIRNSDTDGFVDRDDWIAFEPTQIKSATGNRGTYSKTDPNILYQDPPDEPKPAYDVEDVKALVGIVRTYVKGEGITDFATAVRKFQADYGDGARALDRPFEMAWKRWTNEDRRVKEHLDVAPAPAAPDASSPLHLRIFDYLKGLGLSRVPKNPMDLRKQVAEALGLEPQALADQIDALNDAVEAKWATDLRAMLGVVEKDLAAQVDAARTVEEALPRGHRTLEKQKLQQFSTPLPISVLVDHAAQIVAGDRVVEPTAGTGNLLVAVPKTATILAVELAPRRADLLRAQGYNVLAGDYLSARVTPPTVIVTNPPWGKYSTGKYGRGVALGFAPSDVAERFVAKNLRDLADGGRLVAVMPTTMLSATSFKKWLADNFAVRAIIKSPPKAYDTRATSVDSVLLVVDKVKGGGRLPAVVDARDWQAYIEAVRGIHDRSPISADEGRAPEAPGPDSGGGPDRVPGSPRPGGARSGRNTAVGAGRPADVVAGGSGRGGELDADGAADGATPEPAGASALGVPGPTDDTRREAAVSRFFAPYVRRTTLRGQPHPKLLVEAKQLAGVPYPPLTVTPTPSMTAAIKAGRVSVEQAEQALAVLQANSGPKPHGYLAADAVGVGKSREIAMTLLGAMDRAEAAGQPLRLMLTTKSRDNVEDLLDEIHFVASGRTAGQGGTVPFEVYRIADDYPGAKKAGNAYEPLPKAERAIYIVDSYNVAPYRQALADLELHGIVGDEVQRFTNQEAQIGASWLNLHAQVMRKTPRDQQFFAYFTATPAQKVEDYRYLFGLRLWPVDGFADWLQLVTGGLDEKKARELEEATERGSKKPFDDIIKDTDVQVVGGDADNPNPHQGARRPTSWDSYASNVFAQRLTPAEAEQIPREWKILGRFSARDLWRQGTTFEIHEFALTPAQRKRYDQFVDLSLDIYRTAYKYGLYDKTGKSSRFGVTGMLQFAAKRIQMQPALEEAVRLAKQFAGEGYQPVLSIINVSEMTADKGHLIASIEKINTRLVDTDPDDPESGPVDQGEIPEAVIDRARLLDRVRDLGGFSDPVQYIADELGREKVAFIIGKEKASRRQASAEFQTGARTYAVISGAGTTGINLDQRIETPIPPGNGRRVFLDIQYEWSAMEGVQRYGRVDRASSIHPPRLIALTSGNAAEKKFLATIANRMAALGALSKGGAESTGAAGTAMEEFEITGDDALSAARRAYEESDEPTRRSFATIKSAFRDPNRNGKSPDQEDFDPFKPRPDAHGVGMIDFQLPLLLMPMDQANAFWDKFIRYRDELRAESGERELMRSARFSGEIIERHPLKPHFDVYAVKNEEGRKFGILVGLITPEMPRLRDLLKDARHLDVDEHGNLSTEADIRFQRRYVTFSSGDQIITGLQIPWTRIPAIAKAYGSLVAGEQLDTPERVLAHLRAGETITLSVVNPDSGKNWVLRMRPSDKRIAIDHARMDDRAVLKNNGADYVGVGNYWRVIDLPKFLERWPVPDQVSPTKPPTPPASSGGSGGGLQSAVVPGVREFVEHDVTPAMKAAAEQVAKASDDIRTLFAPDTMGTAARTFADSMRANLAAYAQKVQRARKVMRRAKEAFDPLAGRAEQGDQAAIAEFLAFTDVMDGARPLSTLPPELQDLARLMREMNLKRLRTIKSLGRLRDKHGDDYFGRIWKTDKDGNLLMKQGTGAPGRAPLQGRGSFLKKRSWKTMREGVDLGATPITWNPVEMFLLKLAEQDKWIMGRTVLVEGKALGVAKFIRVGNTKAIPDGWRPYHESFGTVWGPPTVAVKEAYDRKLMDGLYNFARALGVGHVRKVSLGGNRWGYAVGGHHVVTKFAGPEGVLMHEIGHILDERFGLRQQWVNDKRYRQELRNLADLRFEATPAHQLTKSRMRYYRKGEEKIANLVHAFLYAPDKAKKVAPNAYWALHNLAKKHASLKPLLDLQRDGRSLTLAVNRAQVAAGGAVIAGRYYGPPDAVRILDNHLKPGLRGRFAPFDWFRTTGNFLNQVQLGLSAFHVTMTGIEAVVSKVAIGFEELSRGEGLEAAKTLAAAPAATFTNLYKGHKLLRKLYERDANALLIADTIDHVMQAGGGVHRDESFRPYENVTEQLLTALRQGNYPGAALRLPLALIESPTRFIMEWWVPRLKLGAFADMAAMELRTLGPEPSLTEIRRVLGGVQDSIDNRFGQLIYPNLFWSNTLKDVGMAIFRALGWNVGTAREVFGAPLGQVSQIRALASGKAVGGYRPIRMKHTGHDLNGSRIFEPTREPWLTHKGAYVMALVFVIGMMGALYTLFHTGERPKELRDYFFPRTGKKRPDGKDERVSFPSYFKDIYSASKHPFTTLGHKLHPLLNYVFEVLSNEDFYGTELRNPTDPIAEQAKDEWQHVLDTFKPFSVRSFEQRRQDQGDTGISGAESFMGITPAPASVYRTKAEDLMQSYMPPLHRTKEEAEAARTRRSLRSAFRAGDAEAQAGILAGGTLSRRQVGNAQRMAGRTALQNGFTRLTAEQAFKVYEAASPEERAEIRPMLDQKGGLIKNAPPAQQPELYRQYRAVYALPVAPRR